MSDRIFPSEESDELLEKLNKSTGFSKSDLAKIAIALSLTSNETPEKSHDLGGREMRRFSLLGKKELLYKSLLEVKYQRDLTDEEFFGNHSLLKLHLDHGCKLMANLLKECNDNSYLLIKSLAERVTLTSFATVDIDRLKIKLNLGKNPKTNENIFIDFNDTNKHPNQSLAIMGKPGTGKTQMLLHLITEIRTQTNFHTNCIIFDYKGDISSNNRFLTKARIENINLDKERLPINPFVLNSYDEDSIYRSAREKADTFSLLEARIGPVQKNWLVEGIKRAYSYRASEPIKYPDFKDVLEAVKEIYDENKKSFDSLISVLSDLTNYKVFFEHGATNRLFPSVLNRSLVINLSSLTILKELVAFLVIEKIYREMASMPDSAISNNYREIRTVLVIDEAHNYLKYKSPYLERIIREGRSKGVVVFFASQSPNDYFQKDFDYATLLEFCFMFGCDAVSRTSVKDLLGCTDKIATSLQTELAHLPTFHVISKSLHEDEPYSRFIAAKFFDSL